MVYLERNKELVEISVVGIQRGLIALDEGTFATGDPLMRGQLNPGKRFDAGHRYIRDHRMRDTSPRETRPSDEGHLSKGDQTL